MDPIDAGCKTARELVDRFDAGQQFWSISLGGIGPGYEQAIQETAVEFTRAALDEFFEIRPGESNKDSYKRLKVIADKALTSFDDKIGGITGAMYGAACWLAWQWTVGTGGPIGLLKRLEESGQKERRILVSRMILKPDNETHISRKRA